MTEIIISAAVAFIVGFVAAWFARGAKLQSLQKELKDTQDFLGNEKHIKETQRKESMATLQYQEAKEIDLRKKLQKAEQELKIMDENVLLLQKSNDETESLLKASQPEIHALKIKLLEAQNTIARYKAKLQEK